MLETYQELEHLILNHGNLYWFCAFLGTGMFIVQFILNLFFGMDDDLDSIEAEGFPDAGKFKWFSRHALMSFLMIFGWTGITCQKEFELEGISVAIISLAAGSFAFIATRYIFKIVKRLHSSGNVFRIEEAIGKEGVVYQRIPLGGMGKISVSLNQMTQEIDAFSRNQQEISSFTKVKIVEKFDHCTVIVEPI